MKSHANLDNNVDLGHRSLVVWRDESCDLWTIFSFIRYLSIFYQNGVIAQILTIYFQINFTNLLEL